MKAFQEEDHLEVDRIVGPATRNALPDGGPMPTLQERSNGDIVRSLQKLLSGGAWGPASGPIDEFGPKTRVSVEGFQNFWKVTVDGVVGEQTWDVSFQASHKSLKTEVGPQYVIG